jgi:uncharacterized membrane protein YhiD involved in acid resistance
LDSSAKSTVIRRACARTNIRGLTTAASLWVVASIGLAASTGAFFLATAGTLIALLALWPLHVLVGKLHLRAGQLARVELNLKKLEAFARVSRVLPSHRVETVSVAGSKSKLGHRMEMELRLPRGGQAHGILADLETLSGDEVDAVNATEEA